MSKFYEEVCLLEQPFIKDQTISIGQLIATKIGKLGENIAVRRFARFKVGEAGETVADHQAGTQKRMSFGAPSAPFFVYAARSAGAGRPRESRREAGATKP